jgi:hypothetical protein
MTDSRITELKKRSAGLFSDKAGLDDLNQELAENFYPERADFNNLRTLGPEFASNLMNSLPVMFRRDLGNMLSSMLRPPETEWFKIRPENERLREESGVDAWCEYATGVMRRALYERTARFVRSTKEGDHDFVTFGQAALTCEMNTRRDGLLFRCWHLRDLAWIENAEGEIDTIFRKWNPSVRNLIQQFGDKKLHSEVVRLKDEKPDQTVQCMHIVLPSEEHDWQKSPKNIKRFPFVCLYIDIDNEHMIEEIPLRINPWIIPRWQTVSGSQYAFSPATITMLADARLIQIQTMVLLEQGEKAVDPPIIAKRDIFQAAPHLFPGGFTYADMEADESLKDILQVMQPDRAGQVTGLELLAKVEKTLNDGFFLNRLFLPPPDAGEKMTAYEVQRRTQEFIRQALPLFEPVESEYNTPICEKAFKTLLINGAFDPPPEAIRESGSVEFTFESPLKQAKARADVQRFTEVAQLASLAKETLDPELPDNIDGEAAFRDAIRGVGASTEWQRDKKAVKKTRERRNAIKEMQSAMAEVTAGAETAEQVGNAAGAVREGLGIQ